MSSDEFDIGYVNNFISQLKELGNNIQPIPDVPLSEKIEKTIEHVGLKNIFAAAGTLLGLLFIRYGSEAFLRYRAIHKASSIRQLMKGYPSFPSLTQDMSIVIRAIDDKGHLKPIIDEYGEIPERMKELWELVGQTVASSQEELHPIFIPNTKGAVSFITMSVPTSNLDLNLTSSLRDVLQKSHFLPLHTPKRGPLKSMSFLKMNSSIIQGHLHPELVISAIF